MKETDDARREFGKERFKLEFEQRNLDREARAKELAMEREERRNEREESSKLELENLNYC